MSFKTKTVKISSIPFKELASLDQELIKKALEVRTHAQAPYSNYYVGAAVLSSKGTTHTGCNVERCSYSQTTHGEQNAIDSMIAAHGPIKIEKIAVVAAKKDAYVCLEGSTDIQAGMPCGHCLQIIWENCDNNADVQVFSLDAYGKVLVSTIGDLLPFGFNNSYII